MLNMRKVGLELIQDPEMYIVFEKGMRGGVFYISYRYNKANHKYLKSQDSKQESKHIIYLDANYLYMPILSFSQQAASNEQIEKSLA